MKVAGSELLDYVVDENIQIHGGIGFSEELPHARIYRDARINRIYEGTNEIKEAFQLVLAKVLEAQMQGKVDLRQNQYVGLALADMATHILLSESMRLRIRKLLQKGKYAESLLEAVQSILLDEHTRALIDHARKIAYHLQFQSQMSLIEDLVALHAIDSFSQYEVVAEAVLQADGYPFNA